MAEEVDKKAEEAEPKEAAPAEESNLKTIVDIPQMETVIDPDVQDTGSSPVPQMINYLKQYSGYGYCSASRIERLPKDSKKLSTVTGQLIMSYLMKGGKNQDEFKKAYASGDMVLIQVHNNIPTLAEDGTYTSKDVNGNPIKSVLVGTFQLLSKPEDFKPMIVMRTGACTMKELGEKPGTLGIIIGDPYHQVSAAEAAEVIKENQPAAVEPTPTV